MRLLLTAILILTAIQAQASCDDLAEICESIMEARQAGVSRYELEATVPAMSEQEKQMVLAIINDAWLRPVGDSKNSRRAASADFKDWCRNVCLRRD